MCRKLGLSCLCVLVLASFGFVVSVEADSSTWAQIYKDGAINSLIATSDGGYAMVGYIESSGVDDSADVWLVKLDASGNVEWNRTYDGEAKDDKAYSLVETVDGGYAIAGYSTDIDSGVFHMVYGGGSSPGYIYFADFWLIKTDGVGNVEWNQTYGGPKNDYALSLIKTSDGGYAMAGWTESFGAGGRDFWLVKTDSTGYMEWNQTYGGEKTETGWGLTEVSEGGYAVAGWTYSSGYIDDFLLIRTDAVGNVEWNQTYERGGALIATSDGGYAVAAGEEYLLTKLDASGNVEWSQDGDEPEFDNYAHSFVATSDGGYAIAGRSGHEDEYSFWLMKTDVAGNKEWKQTYSGPEFDDHINSVVVTSDGGYAIAGYTYSSATDSFRSWVIKTDEYGVGPDLPVPDRGTQTVIVTTLVAAGLILGVIVLIVHQTTRATKKPVDE